MLLRVPLVEPAGDGARDLHMRQIVLADRHHVGLAEQDVARLMHRVGEQQTGQCVAGSLHFGLHGRVAVQLSLGDQRQERQHKLVFRRNRGMRVNHGLVRVDAGGHIVKHQVEHVVLDVLGGVAIGDHLIIGNDDIRVHAQVLHGDTLADRAEIMAQVQASGRAVAGEHRELARVLFESRHRLIGTLLRGEETRAHLVAYSSHLLFCHDQSFA